MTTDLRTTLAAADPAAGNHYDDAALVRRAREILGATGEVAAAPTTTVLVTAIGQRPRRITTRRAVLALGLAAVLAGAIAVVPSRLAHTSREHRQAAALLEQAADAITATDPPARGDQYWKVTSGGFNLGTSVAADNQMSSALVSQTTVSYLAVDGSRPTYVVSEPGRVIRQVVGTPAAADRPSSRTESVTTFPAPDSQPPSWQGPTAAFLRSLPRDPGALLQRIRDDSAGAGTSPDGEVVVTVADVLRSGLVPADLRAALYRALAAVPGVVVSASDASLDGASGIAFAYEEAADGIRQELVVDPTDGALVGERQVATRAIDGIPAGTVIGQSTISRELVDAVPPEVLAAAR